VKLSKCLNCGNKYAYIGFKEIECPNKKCCHFSQRQKDFIIEHVTEDEEESLKKMFPFIDFSRFWTP